MACHNDVRFFGSEVSLRSVLGAAKILQINKQMCSVAANCLLSPLAAFSGTPMSAAAIGRGAQAPRPFERVFAIATTNIAR